MFANISDFSFGGKSLPDKYELKYHCDFYFYFPDYGAAHFSYIYWLLVRLIWEITVHVLNEFLIVMLDFCYQAVEILNILRINPLSDVWFINIFSRSVECLFTLLAVSFAVQKLLVWCSLLIWRRQWHPTPVFLPGESQGRGSLVGWRLWGHTESDMTEMT